MKKTWIVIGLLAVFCAACNDDKDDVVCVEGENICVPVDASSVRYTCVNNAYVRNVCPSGNSCTNGECIPVSTCSGDTAYCDGNVLNYCSNGVFKQMDCGARICSGSVCVDDPNQSAAAACTDGETRCNTNGIHQVCKGNIWTDAPCVLANGEYCRAGVCVQCDNEERRCASGNTSQYCLNGRWVTKDVCNHAGADICEEGICKDSTACDYDGSKRCSGNTPQVCKGGKWVSEAACSVACLDGACAECTEDVCVGDVVKYCVNGKFLISDEDIAACKKGGEGVDQSKCIGYDDCAADEMYCRNSSMDGNVCVYKASDLGLKEAGNYPIDGIFNITSCQNYGEKYGIMYGLVCDEFTDGVYCSVSMLQSMCQKKADSDEIIVLGCEGSKLVQKSCENSCEMLSSVTSAPNYSKLTPEANSSYDVAVCDDKIVSSVGVNAIVGKAYGSSSDDGNNPSTGSDWEDCSNETCSVGGAQMKCGDYCVENYGAGQKAWCDSNGNAQCSASQPSGSGSQPSGGSCDVYDCSAEYASECVSYGASTALCDAEYIYCEDPYPAGDSDCSAGQKAYGDASEHYCIVVGSDESCLGGGGSSTGSDWEDCSDEMCNVGTGEMKCGDYCVENYGAGQKAWCDSEGNAQCSASQPSGGSSSGGGDWEDCSDEACTTTSGAEIMCGDYCVENYGAGQKAWCTSDGTVKCSASQPSGDECNENYTESCDGNIGSYCYEGEIAQFECDSSAPCAVRKSDTYADCAESCSPGSADAIVCGDYFGLMYFSYIAKCSETTAGGYAYFPDNESREICEGECVDGVGCK